MAGKLHKIVLFSLLPCYHKEHKMNINGFKEIMNKESLAAVANTSALAGTGTGFMSFLNENSSVFTLIIVFMTFVVTATAHYFDKKNKIRATDIKARHNEMINDIEKQKLQLEKEKLQLEIKKQQQSSGA